jgi:hypothetical protein
MALIVLSHQLGAGGPEIGLALSQRLGYRYVDQELLQDAGLRYGLAEDKLSHLDESKPSFFERFDTECLAAASIGQVHRARLRDGREVVVKVQRPGLRTQIEADLSIIRLFAQLLAQQVRELAA